MNDIRRERYVRAKTIACAALDLQAPERERFLGGACEGDDELRSEVAWLLQAAENTSDTNLPFPLPRPLRDSAGSCVVGTRDSQYRIVRQLGEGGMGVVYLAERLLDPDTPEEIRQPVALKFLCTGGPPSASLLKRFAEERRILATLSHPGIAHLIDGGSTRDGRPFLALEYVEGERIDQWCERNRLSLRERVALFLKVCAAVRYAHQRLVIHRDIKPANILVTMDGEPKLLDFGIARLLDEVGGLAAAQTMTAQRALTLAYASPEQVRGLPLGTAADVWSLGVVLYQLVCGARPFGAGDTDSALDLSNAIVTGRPLAPSRRVRLRLASGAGALREVPADIDAIVLKALRANPAERYASVGELSADLERFLALRPVRARRGHHWYRAMLYLRRHRFRLAVPAVLLLLLGGFADQSARQLHRVEMERDKTLAIAGFMQDLFENADPVHAGGGQLSVRDVLDRGAARLLQRNDIDPPVRVSLLLSMARSYNQLSLGAQAVAVLEAARGLLRSYPASALERARVMAALGPAYASVMDLQSAIRADQQAIDLWSTVADADPNDILRSHIDLLRNHIAALDLPPATMEASIRRIVEQMEGGPARSPELHAQALAVLAAAQDALGQDPAAIGSARRALREADSLYSKDDPRLISYRFTLARVSIRTRPADAVRDFRQAITDYDRLVATPGPGQAGLLASFGRALGELGQSVDAASILERACQQAHHVSSQAPDFYLGTLDALAHQYLELGRDADAAGLLMPHLAQLHSRAAGGSLRGGQNLADALNVLGSVALRAGRADRATHYFREAHERLAGQANPVAAASYAASLAGLGEAMLADGHPGQAAIWLGRLRDCNRRQHVSAQSASALDAALLAVRIDMARGHFAQAASLAATEAATAGSRWSACSPRVQSLRQLEIASAGHFSAISYPPLHPCPGSSAVAAR